MYTDYHVSAKVVFDTVHNSSKIVTLYPLANSSEMARDAMVKHLENEYEKDFIKSVEFLHSFPI